MSRTSRPDVCVSRRSVVRPPASVKVAVLVVASLNVPSGSSKISVKTTFSSGTTSRYSPWKATSKPPSATIA